MGRRLKLTDAVQDELCVLIRKACPIQIACRAVGVSKSSFYRWCSEGEAEETARQEAVEQGPELVTTRQAEALVGVPIATLRKHARAGEIKAKKQRGRWLLDRAGLLLWAEPEGSVYLQFLEAIRRAEAAAECNLVETWRELSPKDWRACRDLLARRWPERWSERRQIDASIKADVDLQAKVEGEMVHEVEFTQDEVKGSIERFRAFLLQEAAEAEQIQMNLGDLLAPGEEWSVEEIAEAMGKDQQEILDHLRRLGAKKLTADRWVLPRASGADDDLDQADEPAQAADGEPVVMKPYPVSVPTGRVPIVAVKTEFAKRRDGEI